MSTLTDSLDANCAPAASDRPVFGGVEAGGTKWVCAKGTGPGDLRQVEVIPTTAPPETLGRVVEFFKGAGVRVAALGIGSFGPVDVRVGSETFGWITKTAKPGWSNINVVGTLSEELDIPIAFDTDVNAAALAEWRWGAARGLSNFIYITVGTGIGAAIVLDGRPIHGLMHPEFGHVLIAHDHVGDPFPGSCPFHRDCLEGLASGEALRARYGKPAEELDDQVAWALEAHYLAMGIMNAVLTVSPERVVLGGGVVKKPGLLPIVRTQVKQLMAGYNEVGRHDDFIVPPALG
ncbi:MAG: ROK family protein, partial [Bacteroidota bacterium]